MKAIAMGSLPNQIEALWYVCRLLGVSEKDLGSVNRQTIFRATHDQPISAVKRDTLHRAMESAIFEKLRRHGVAPPGIATAVLDEIVVYCLGQYELLSPHLHAGNDATEHTYWVLLREVWAPTIHQVFRHRSGVGLGNEFRLPGNWYIPQCIDGKFTSPVSKLLDRWLRTTGLRTAYGLTKSAIKFLTEEEAKAWEAEKKKLGRWLTGKNTPTLPDLYAIIKGHSDQAEWLDSADSWRARFFLAHALTKACNDADAALGRKFRKPLDEIGKVLSELEKEPIYQDRGNILSDPQTFFAVRLWIKHLKASGEFASIVEGLPDRLLLSFPPEISEEEIERARQKAEWQINPVNHIAAHLYDVAGCDPDTVDEFKDAEQIRHYLMGFASNELRRLLGIEMKTARERPVPQRTLKPIRRNQSSS